MSAATWATPRQRALPDTLVSPSARVRALLFLVPLALLFLGCGPRDIREAQPEYQQLLLLVRTEADPGALWFAHTAPPAARPLMASLRLNAVLYDTTRQRVLFRSGGGYLPESGYVYCLPGADSTCAVDLEPVAGQWFSL